MTIQLQHLTIFYSPFLIFFFFTFTYSKSFMCLAWMVDRLNFEGSNWGSPNLVPQILSFLHVYLPILKIWCTYSTTIKKFEFWHPRLRDTLIVVPLNYCHILSLTYIYLFWKFHVSSLNGWSFEFWRTQLRDSQFWCFKFCEILSFHAYLPILKIWYTYSL